MEKKPFIHSMYQAQIIGTGSCLPKRVLTNKDLEDIVDTSDKWITRRTGIKERHISSNNENETTTELATQASLKAIEMAGIESQDIDLIITGTVTSDRQFPSTACMVQDTLKATKAAGFDVSAGCSGFLYALSIANNAIRCGTSKTALVIGVDRLSSITNWLDRTTCVLLADGAGAVVLNSTTENRGILSTHIRSDGALWDLLYSSPGNSYSPKILHDLDQMTYHLRMEGKRLFKKAINCLTSIAKEALQYNSLSSSDINLVVPHQANQRIIEGLAKSLSIPLEKIYSNIQLFGNTSSASIPIALDNANREGRIKKNDYILLSSFGAGLTWASSILNWSR